MADKHHTPLSPANANLRSDQESATRRSAHGIKRKNRTKLIICISVLVVIQIVIGAVIGLVVMRAKGPKIMLGRITVHNLTAVPATPSFDINIATQIRIRNRNWGPYKFDGGKVSFTYNGETVGQVTIPKGKAAMLQTKKYDVNVNLNSKALRLTSDLRNELNTGVLAMNSEAEMNGKVELLMVMKKKKTAKMNCRLEFNLALKQIQFLKCY